MGLLPVPGSVCFTSHDAGNTIRAYKSGLQVLVVLAIAGEGSVVLGVPQSIT